MKLKFVPKISMSKFGNCKRNHLGWISISFAKRHFLKPCVDFYQHACYICIYLTQSKSVLFNFDSVEVPIKCFWKKIYLSRNFHIHDITNYLKSQITLPSSRRFFWRVDMNETGRIWGPHFEPHRCSSKLFLKISQYSQVNTCVGVSF